LYSYLYARKPVYQTGQHMHAKLSHSPSFTDKFIDYSSWIITLLLDVLVCSIAFYYMASSVSGQDEPNPALWLATRAGKIELSCPLGTTRRVPQEKFPRKPHNKSYIDQACSVKITGYWPRSSFACLWTSTPSRSINTQKIELGQYPAILTSHLVNNPYIFLLHVCILTCPTGSSKYGTTRKNIQWYYTPKHLVRYIYMWVLN